MTKRIRFKLIWIAEIWMYIYVGIVAKFSADKYSLEGIDRPESLVALSFMGADLRLWVFCLVFILLLTASFSRLPLNVRLICDLQISVFIFGEF